MPGLAVYFCQVLGMQLVSDNIDHKVLAPQGNRAFFAFCLDGVLYSVFQAILMDSAPARMRFTPFFGLAYWLVTAKPAKAKQG